VIKLAIFASGGGSNAAKIIEYFVTHKTVEISLIVCNKANAGVTEIASKNNIPSRVVSKLDLSDPVFITDLEKKGIAYIVLAGFLLQIPALLIKHFPAKIINIHPALLPKYGGKGMYGHHVHEAVVNNNETVSGCTIHIVNEHLDEGAILFQAATQLTEPTIAAKIAEEVLQLEHRYFAKCVDAYIESQN